MAALCPPAMWPRSLRGLARGRLASATVALRSTTFSSSSLGNGTFSNEKHHDLHQWLVKSYHSSAQTLQNEAVRLSREASSVQEDDESSIAIAGKESGISTPLSQFNAVELAHGVYNTHDAKLPSEQARIILTGFAQEASTRVSEFQADALAQMTYCFHQAKVNFEQWYRAVSTELKGRLDEMLAGEVASTLLILARENVHDSELFQHAAHLVSKSAGFAFERQNEYTTRQLALVAEAFTLCNDNNRELAKCLSKDVHNRLARYTKEDLETVAKYVDACGEGSSEFSAAVARHGDALKRAEQDAASANEDHDPTNIIYNMYVPDAHGASHRLKPRKFVLGSPNE